jgi:DNA-binding NarL/FixJ family response regulator
MRQNGQNIDPQESIYKYTKSTQEVENLEWTGSKPIKIIKSGLNMKSKRDKEILDLFDKGYTKVEIVEELNYSILAVSKCLHKYKRI